MTIYAFYCFSCIVGVFHATLVALTTIWINQTIKICKNYIHNVAFINADTWKIQLCDVAWKKIPRHYWQAVLSRHLDKSIYIGDYETTRSKD